MDRKYFLPHDRNSPKKTIDLGDKVAGLRQEAAEKFLNKNSGKQARDLIQFDYSIPYNIDVSFSFHFFNYLYLIFLHNNINILFLKNNKKVNEINIDGKHYRRDSDSQKDYGKKSRN